MANIVIKRSIIDHYLFRSGGNIFIGVGCLTGVMVRGFGIGTGESGTEHSVEKLKFSFKNHVKEIGLGLFENNSIDDFGI